MKRLHLSSLGILVLLIIFTTLETPVIADCTPVGTNSGDTFTGCPNLKKTGHWTIGRIIVLLFQFNRPELVVAKTASQTVVTKPLHKWNAGLYSISQNNIHRKVECSRDE